MMQADVKIQTEKCRFEVTDEKKLPWRPPIFGLYWLRQPAFASASRTRT